MRRLSLDTIGEAGLAGAFVLLATFIGVGAVIIGSTMDLARSNLINDAGDWSYLEGYQIIGEIEYNMSAPILGWNATGLNATDVWDHEADENLHFVSEYEEITVGIIRDNDLYGYLYHGLPRDETLYQDFFMMFAEWGWWSNDDTPISFDAVVENQVPLSNQSATPFYLHNVKYSLVITTPGTTADFETDLYSGIFNVKIGIPTWGTDSLSSTSMWTVIGQLMTASLPDVHPVINIMLAIPFWSAMVVMVYLLVVKLVPF